MDDVTIISYPRIHLGLLELSGSYTRIDGGAGLAVSILPMTVTVSEATGFYIDSDHEQAKRIACYTVSDLKHIIPSTKIRITISSQARLHIGLGFSTQCALTVACAILTYFNIPFSRESLARAVRRGGTSGIGIHSFFDGGFVVDGGHLFPEEKDSIGPTSQYVLQTIPPLVARHPFPDWTICIALPNEIDFWKKNTPVPEDESNYLCKNLLLGILPALCAGNFEAFCRAIDNSTRYGLKKREIHYWQPQYDKRKHILEECGWRGITLSSLGPALIGFSDADRGADDKILKQSEEFADVWVTKARNSGYDKVSGEKLC